MSKQSKNKIFISLVLVVIAISMCTFALVGCGPKADFTIGILQFVKHDALGQANQGFQDKLTELLEAEKKTVKFLDENAHGEIANNTTVADQFILKGVDLIYAIATPSAQTVNTKVEESGLNIPVLFNAVTDPVDAKLVTAKEGNTNNVTGCSDLALDGFKKQFELMLLLEPDVTSIGFIFSANEDNSRLQKEKMEAIINEYNTKNGTNIKFNPHGIAGPGPEDIELAFKKIAADSEIIYMPTDNIISQSAAALHNYNKNLDKPRPIVCGEIIPNKRCGIATYGIDYYKLGEKAAEMAFDILMGKKQAKDIPYYQPVDLDFSISYDIAKELGYTINDNVLALENATK